MSDSRKVFRECMTYAAKVDMEGPHRPVRFIDAEDDEIVPASLCERNTAAYTDPTSRFDRISFSDRGRFVRREPGRQDVATSIVNRLEEAIAIRVARPVDLRPPRTAASTTSRRAPRGRPHAGPAGPGHFHRRRTTTSPTH